MLKNKIIKMLSILLVVGLIFGTMPTIFAEEEIATTEEITVGDSTENITVSAGLTPDNILYVFDKLLENIQITLTLDDTKKTLLLMTISEERLAEAEYLVILAENEEIDDEEWNQLFQNVIDDYRTTVDKVLEITEQVAYEIDNETKTDLDELISIINSAVDFDIVALKNNDQINEVRDNALLVANIVKDLDPEGVAKIRALGVGYGQISQIFALSNATDLNLDEIAALFTEDNMGLGQVATELGVKTSDLTKNNDAINDNAVKLNNAFNNNGNTTENQNKNQIKVNQNNISDEENTDDVDVADDGIIESGEENVTSTVTNASNNTNNNSSNKDKTNNNSNTTIKSENSNSKNH